jgi:hypothetical protein
MSLFRSQWRAALPEPAAMDLNDDTLNAGVLMKRRVGSSPCRQRPQSDWFAFRWCPSTTPTWPATFSKCVRWPRRPLEYSRRSRLMRNSPEKRREHIMSGIKAIFAHSCRPVTRRNSLFCIVLWHFRSSIKPSKGSSCLTSHDASYLRKSTCVFRKPAIIISGLSTFSVDLWRTAMSISNILIIRICHWWRIRNSLVMRVPRRDFSLEDLLVPSDKAVPFVRNI